MIGEFRRECGEGILLFMNPMEPTPDGGELINAWLSALQKLPKVKRPDFGEFLTLLSVHEDGKRVTADGEGERFKVIPGAVTMGLEKFILLRWPRKEKPE